MRSSLLTVLAALMMGASFSAAAATDADAKFIRAMVVEEHTDTWCTWCPRGYVGMEYMREHYGDANYIGIAIHRTSGSSTDPMHCESYTGYMQKWQDGFPNCSVNREKTMDPSSSSLESTYRSRADLLGPAAMTITADNASNESVDTEVTLEMRTDTPYHTYGIAWVVTEDNVGPYPQKNGYSGSGQSMGGFESMGSRPNVMFNDVARRIVDWKGNRNVLPSAMDAGKKYSVNRTISMAEVSKVNNAHVIALLIDTTSGEIVTGAKVALGTPSAVTLPQETPLYSIDGRTVSLSPESHTTAVYSVTGATVATLQPGSVATLPTGIYIIGGKKLIIR